MALKTLANLKTGRDFTDVLDSMMNLKDGGAITGAVSTAATLTTDGRPVLGTMHGLSFGTPTVGSNACTLVVDSVNAPVYTGGAALAALLPAATAGAVCVFMFSQDPAGGTAALTINAAGSDVFETGSTVMTTNSNLALMDISTAGETALVYTPTNNTVNLYSYGATVEFICVTAGKWFVSSTISPDIGITAGAATGTMLFAA